MNFLKFDRLTFIDQFVVGFLVLLNCFFFDKQNTKAIARILRNDMIQVPYNEALTLIPFSSYSLDISEDQTKAFYQGEIGDDFGSLMKGLPETIEVLRIESKGGSLAGSLIGAKEIKQRSEKRKEKNLSPFRTVSIHYCYSACTLVFQAGDQREASSEAVFIYHRPFVISKSVNKSLPEKEREKIKKQIQNFINMYREYGLSKEFVKKVTGARACETMEMSEKNETHCSKDHYFRAQDLKKKNVNVVTKQHGSYLEIYNYEQSLAEIKKICSVDNTAKKTEEICENYKDYMEYLNIILKFEMEWTCSQKEYKRKENCENYKIYIDQMCSQKEYENTYDCHSM